GVQPSMGTAGDAYDNAMCESFFGTLEAELLMREHFDTHDQARRRIFSFLELVQRTPPAQQHRLSCTARIRKPACAGANAIAVRVAHRRAASRS
ncbi:MAG TPA: integrase core domain-containing protein, partial [Paraburkholderia sp.]|nr:integrase core domain-containing protein [Paraburkholderia sp.]